MDVVGTWPFACLMIALGALGVTLGLIAIERAPYIEDETEGDEVDRWNKERG